MTSTAPQPHNAADMTSTASQADTTSTPLPTRRPPRTCLVGGYIFDSQTLVPWAEHLTKYQYDMVDVSIVSHAFLEVKQFAWRKYGMTIYILGEEVTVEGMSFIVATQRREFPDGYLGYPEDKLPQFKEGAREARVREVMIKEGFDANKLHFGTKLTGQYE